MPIPIPVVMRRQIVERHQAGISLSQIAKDLEMSYESVRNVWRIYRKEGRIEPNYVNCGREIQASPRVYRAALYLKRLHPQWGAELIRQLILAKWPAEAVPVARSLQRWFQKAELQPIAKARIADARMGREKRVHATWQVDSREGMQLASGQNLVWVLVSDEASGAILSGKLFPPHPC